jgi:cytochrome P450
MGVCTDENPWERIVPEACDCPDVFYGADVLPAGQGGAWIFRRQEDLRAVYNDTEHFSSKGFSSFSILIGENWDQVPAEQDPPEHTYFRTLLNPVFAPGSMKKMEDTVRQAGGIIQPTSLPLVWG